jgi:hypothetical protein
LMRFQTQRWAISLLALTTAVLLIVPVWRATLHVSFDYKEGWNAVLAAQWMSGKPLYPAFDALSANNYPPLSFYVVGWVGRWLGDYLLAGRLLAFVGLFTSAVAVAAVVKWITGRTRAALMSGLLVLGYSAAVYPRYVGLDDPQWLGHGMMLLGLLAFLASEQRGWLFLLSAGLMLAAGFVKHILLPIPVAASLWLLMYRRDVLALWFATCVALLVSALLFFFAVHGLDFFEGVFRDARDWRLGRLYVAPLWFQTQLPLLLLGALVLPSVWRLREGRLVVFYAAFSAALAICIVGGAGVAINAIFDLEIALCLIIGIGIGELDENDDRSAPVEVRPRMAQGPSTARWGLLLVLVLGVYLPQRLLEVRELWKYGRAGESETAQEIDFLARQPGPVACENLSLCYWAGKGFEIDFFLLGQKLNQGLVEPHLVTERIRSRYYAAIQTGAKDGAIFLPVSINREIADNYEVVRTTTGAVLVPRRQ